MGRKLVNDLSYQDDLTKTADKNIRGGPTTLYGLFLDNTETGGAKCWIKLFDNDGSDIDEGTTLPEIIIPCAAYSAAGADAHVGGIMDCLIPSGLAFTEGITMFASKEDGNDATADPDGDLEVRLVTQETS
jgi:hypothetical protein